VIGAFTLAARKSPRGLCRWVAAAGIGFGTSLALFSLSRSFWLSAALLVPTGFCMMTVVGSANTLIQVMVPDDLRGRVMAIFSMMFLGMAPFGSLLAGALAHRLGAPLTVTLGGAACVAGAVAFAVRLPVLAAEARELSPALRPSPTPTAPPDWGGGGGGSGSRS
jgi:MFS family permease